MKISKKTLLIMGGIFSISSLGLMFVSAAEKILSPDLDNAIQHINEVKFVFTGTNGAEATLKFLNGNLVKIEADSGFLLSEDNQDSFGLMGGEYSSVLGGYRNRKGGTYDVVLGGSGNSVRGSYNSILGGEGNSITEGSYNTIIGGIENKINSKSSLYSVILGGISNMIGSGKSSVVMGTHSSVNGSHSVVLGSGSKVEANNSFLWTDGSNSDTLNSDNVFAIIAQSGAVINTDKAHSFAKLTLGGPMIVFSGRTGENIACGAGEGGGILKVVQSENNQMCMCSCDGNGWSSMFGKGRCMSVCDVSLEPECGDTVTKVGKNIGGIQYAVYSGSCKKGEIVEGTGAYLVTKDNKVHWSCQSEDGLVVGCSGNVNAEGGYITVKTCGGTPPTGVGVVTGSSTYVGNGNKVWEGNDNLDKNNLLPCQWTCTTGYEIDHQNGGRCKAKTRTANCEGDIPSLAEQKTGHGTYKQTWDGSTWTPPSKSWSYDASECGYKCKTNYTWNGSSCVLGTGSCGPKPTGNGYKFGTGIYTYGYTPTSWTYTGGTLGPCLYKCDTENGYSWNSTSKKCELGTQNCGGTKPTGNGYKFGTGIYTYGYMPTSWTYTGGTLGPCLYKCDTGYIWSGGKCVLGTGSCGTKLAGSGYVFGPATYMFGYTPTSWTYTGGTLGPCLYKCDKDWELESASSKCIKTVYASCGNPAEHFICDGEGTPTNQQTGRDGNTVKGWTWTCQGTTGGSSQECIECNTERGYMELNGQCVSEGVSCKELSIKTRNMTNGGSTQVTCSTVGGNAYISIHCGNGAIISGSNISELTGTCTYPKEDKQYNLVCYVGGKTNNNCKGTVSNSVSYGGGGGNYCKCAPNGCEKETERGYYDCKKIPLQAGYYACSAVGDGGSVLQTVQCKDNSSYVGNNHNWWEPRASDYGTCYKDESNDEHHNYDGEEDDEDLGHVAATYGCACFDAYGMGNNGPIPHRLDAGSSMYVYDNDCCTCVKHE